VTPPDAPGRERRAAVAGAVAAAAWIALCARWFDGPHRGPALLRVPPALLALVLLVAGLAWLAARRAPLLAMVATGSPGKLGLAVALALAFRLPLAWQGGAGYVTADGALSGIVALRIREGLEHLVFVPHVPYSGSLKSHLAAALGLAVDLPRAFALVSVLFYCLFVAAAFLLAERAWRRSDLALAAGLYLAFAPAFVTRYSLSNDGNYVEVLALGSAALLAVVAWDEDRSRLTLPLLAGLLLGLAFWCHILAVIHAAAAVLFLLGARRAAGPALVRLAGGFALGYTPGLLWNAANRGESFRYLLPGAAAADDGAALPLHERAWALLSDHAVVLAGYDHGYAGAADLALRAVAIAVLTAVAWALLRSRSAIGASPALRAVLLLALVNVVVAATALPHIPGNPRYLLFSILAVAVLVARVAAEGWGRPLLAVLLIAGALGSWAQAPGTLRADAQWRRFVADLESAGVRWCYTDFFLATKINFLSGERVVCSAKLGPTTTEYFFDYRSTVEAAPAAALVAVNPTAAEKLERRLERLGVSYERRDLMKPVLMGLSRKVDAAEIFPGRDFPLR
jgi:hypothetical protein